MGSREALKPENALYTRHNATFAYNGPVTPRLLSREFVQHWPLIQSSLRPSIYATLQATKRICLSCPS